MNQIAHTLKRKWQVLIMIASVAMVLTAFQNCSDVSFNQEKGSGDSAQSPGGDPGQGGQGGTNPPSGSVPGQVGQNGGTTGGPPVTGGPGGTTNPVTVPPGYPPPPPGSTDAPPQAPPGSTFPPGSSIPAGTVLPKVTRGEPPCQRGQWCEYHLTLDKAYTMIVDFDWRTNDDPNRQVNVPNGYIRAVPNTHYVPGSGHVRFLPGELVRKIYVLNINPDPALNIVIPFIFSACQYGAVNTSCQAMFN